MNQRIRRYARRREANAEDCKHLINITFSTFSTSPIPHILSEGLPRERSSKMANNMYLDPAFSSFAASKEKINETYEKHEFKAQGTKLSFELNRSWIGLLHDKHTIRY